LPYEKSDGGYSISEYVIQISFEWGWKAHLLPVNHSNREPGMGWDMQSEKLKKLADRSFYRISS